MARRETFSAAGSDGAGAEEFKCLNACSEVVMFYQFYSGKSVGRSPVNQWEQKGVQLLEVKAQSMTA